MFWEDFEFTVAKTNFSKAYECVTVFPVAATRGVL